MEMKKSKKQEVGVWTGWMLKSLLCAYTVTGIFLLLLALLLYKINLNESKVTVGIIVVYVISTFSGGFIAGKQAKTKKFLWGLLSGIAYFIILFVVSVLLYRTIQDNGIGVMTTFLLCAGGGMLGGMVS